MQPTRDRWYENPPDKFEKEEAMKVYRVWAYRSFLIDKSRVIKSSYYRGFRIDLLDNGHLDFKFEYVVVPMAPDAKSITALAIRRSREKGIFDPTSHRLRKMAIESAKERINELRSPFWLKDWKTR